LNESQNKLPIVDVTMPKPEKTLSSYEFVKDLFGENDMRTIEFWRTEQSCQTDPNFGADAIENEMRRKLSPGKRLHQPSTIGETSPMKRLNLNDAVENCKACGAIGQCIECPILTCFKDDDFAEYKHDNVMDGGNNSNFANISQIGGTSVQNMSPSPGGVKRSGKCFNCGKEGHWSYECTSPRTKSACFKCGKVGHWMKDCNM
jgi:Zinc knuckle